MITGHDSVYKLWIKQCSSTEEPMFYAMRISFIAGRGKSVKEKSPITYIANRQRCMADIVNLIHGYVYAVGCISFLNRDYCMNLRTRKEVLGISFIIRLLNPLKPKRVLILFKNSVRTAKITPHFTITKV
jgi:hypothetical protein